MHVYNNKQFIYNSFQSIISITVDNKIKISLKLHDLQLVMLPKTI